MRSLVKVSCLIGLVAAVAGATAADAQSRHAVRDFNAYDAVAPSARSIPYDAGGPAYTAGQRDIDTSSDFQLQGR